MNTKKKWRFHAVIDAKLSGIAKSLPEPPPWNERWLRLGPGSTWEERLFVCQAVRDSGSIPDEAGYFLVSWIIEDLTSIVEPDRIDQLHSMNRRESRRASDQIFSDLLNQNGEQDMAERFRTDPQEHARRREIGRRFFFGEEGAELSEYPSWVKEFVRALSPCLLTVRSPGHLGIRYRVEHGNWEISVYPVFGEGDIEKTGKSAASPNFAWDIEVLQSVFDSIEGSGWYAVPTGETENAYIWIEGEYQEHEVFLRLLVSEPELVEPGEKSEVLSVVRESGWSGCPEQP